VTSFIRPGLQYPRLWLCVGLIIAAMIATACLMPARNLPDVGLSDKIKHGLSHALLAFWFASVIVHRRFLWLFVALVAFGGLIELAQEWMNLGRHAEFADLLANIAGTTVGVAVAATALGRWAGHVESLFSRMPA
jgi:VanZ family protein